MHETVALSINGELQESTEVSDYDEKEDAIAWFVAQWKFKGAVILVDGAALCHFDGNEWKRGGGRK